MDLETIIKRINELEIQLDSIKKTLSSQNTKIGSLEDKTVNFLEKVREQKNEISRVSTSVSSLGQFDAALTKIRVDFSRQIEESEERQNLNLKMKEKLQSDQIRKNEQSIESLKDDLNEGFEEKIKQFIDQDTRVLQQFKEIESQVVKKLRSDDEFKSGFTMLQQDVSKNKKILDTVSVEFDAYKKRVEELRAKIDIITNDIKTNESQLNEIVATETERKQAYITYIDQQALTKNERERAWQEWRTQYEEAFQQVNKLLPELQKQQIDMEKTKQSFDSVIERIDRRANEITEMYRLMDEKFRQEWANYKSDLEKRSTGMKLVLDEKQTDLMGNFLAFRDRVVTLEDETHEMREALLLMSREIQKGMQSLMNMVHGWMDAFDKIKTNRS